MKPKSALVRDYMARHLVSFRADTDVLDAIHELVKHRIAEAEFEAEEMKRYGIDLTKS